MSRDASLQELLGSSFNTQMTNVYTAIPGIVVTVRNNLEDMTLDVQPSVNVKTKQGEIKERPVVVNVPFQFPASSVAALTYPINVGDSVLLIFSMRGLDTWKRSNGGVVTPTDFRKFDKRDCFAIPGVFPSSKSINDPAKRVWPHSTQDTVLVSNIGKPSETEVRILQGGGVVINTNQDVVANCTNASINAQQAINLSSSSLNITAGVASISIGNTTWAGNIEHTGNYTMAGTATFNGIAFDTHKHGTSPPPSNP